MSDEKPRDNQIVDGQEHSQRPGAGLPKHTVEVEAAQIVEIEPTRRRPPPLPQDKPPPLPQDEPPRSRERTEEAPSASSGGRYALSPDGVPWHKLDYREAGLLAQVDGERDRQAVISASGLDAEAGTALFDGLVERGLIVPS